MKILHITASPLVPNSGITVVLEALSSGQNEIDGVESKVLSLKDDLKKINSSYFVYYKDREIDIFLDEFQPDVAIIHSFYHIEFMVIAKALIKRGIPFFIEPHGSFGKTAMKKSQIKKKIANGTVFHQLIHKAVGYIFTNAGELNDSVYRTGNDLYIPNGVVEEIVLNSNEKSYETKINPVYYYLGRYDIHHKGLDYLFDALDILEHQEKKYEVRLYGTGNKEQIEYVNNRVDRFKNLNIKNMGTIFGEEKKVALENANILLLTSRYEGSPMTVLDGFSYGNPCVVTPGTNVSDEVIKNHLGWKTELNPQEIAQTIIRASEDYKENAQYYYDNCKRYVLSNYSWTKLAYMSVEKISTALRR